MITYNDNLIISKNPCNPQFAKEFIDLENRFSTPKQTIFQKLINLIK